MKKIDPEILENLEIRIDDIDTDNLYQSVNDIKQILYRLISLLRATIIETPKEH